MDEPSQQRENTQLGWGRLKRHFTIYFLWSGHLEQWRGSTVKEFHSTYAMQSRATRHIDFYTEKKKRNCRTRSINVTKLWFCTVTSSKPGAWPLILVSPEIKWLWGRSLYQKLDNLLKHTLCKFETLAVRNSWDTHLTEQALKKCKFTHCGGCVHM